MPAKMRNFAASARVLPHGEEGREQAAAGTSDEFLATEALARGEAFEELVRRYQNRIYSLAYRMTGDNVEAYDLTQEAFLRCYAALPWGLRVLGSSQSRDPQLASAIGTLRAWTRAGCHRIDRNHDGVYEDSTAIRIMDAWWPLWVQAHLERGLSKPVWDTCLPLFENGIDNDPNWAGIHRGSAYQGSVYGQIQKDLRRVVGAKEKGRYSRIYCGNGSLEACRSALQASLSEALAVTPAQIYGHGACAEDPQASCFDMNRWSSASAISVPPFPFQNRPTFQQVVEPTKTLPR